MESVLADRIRGVLFGQAVGDALGFGTEFLSRSEVIRDYPSGLRSYSQIRQYSYITRQYEQLQDWRWQPGDWTDDTDQMLCILDSLLAHQKLDIHDIAARLHQWAVTDGFGIGGTVYKVVHDPEFLHDPHRVAEQQWESRNHQSAANGGVMRTSVLGIWEYPYPERVRFNAEQACRITHADPRCLGSCVAVCLAICRLLEGVNSINKLIDTIALEVQSYHPEMEVYFAKTVNDSLEELDLDEGLNTEEQTKWGYTLKTLGAAFWALRHAKTFTDGLLAIVHEGGDADTNAAVAGALLGARFGYQSIEQEWIEGLIYRQQLEERCESLIQLCSQWQN
ncbi:MULTISPECIES: ADP-ribosylglycohydrolase family protein [unclassified Coleofasciculus]|uniref:ADP-ribosylglycohydrolase family protein n=1 Tax=unclassified Coleofasciculus TaxID=2692782 RepID=UPI0018827344|nr:MULTISPECIES: ADP-ribosylglycohydrolase family protein [unclassified Coleofasciculus]MBE9128778.1 ADP-ribosylglycohydrolase family protein [Coleofasciculus sp. LEGE 07081]MBE9151211.1 ADP-ribosylglycohydrolase family protein [Coleofasciculus sp. LEGE 07092]